MSGDPEMRHTAGTVLARGAGETEAAGRELAAKLAPGDLVLADGDVGAGKSTLIRAAMRELGVEGAIPSPTFTIGRLYEGPTQRMPVAHLDLYRLGGLESEDPDLLDQYFGPDRVSFVEWPGAAEWELSEMATRVVRVAIEHIDPESRGITVKFG
jgi:tRNA threonylcarbamoyladenosine biosynthesis protein TsaE